MSGPAPSITYAVDGPNAAPAQGDVLYYDGTKWGKLAPGTAGQALLTGGAGANPSWGSAGVTAHSGLTGLTSGDDHTQYVYLTPGASARNAITAGGAAVVPLTIQLAAAQSANAINVTSSGGTAGDRFKVLAAGSVVSASYFQGTIFYGSGVYVGYGESGNPSAVSMTSNGTYLYIGNNAYTSDSTAVHIRNKITITPQVQTTGSPNGFLMTGPAHTTLAASTEAIDAYFNLARTVQFATGALPTQRAVVITPPTLAFVGASTVTNAITVDITGAPVAGTNATITTSHGLRVAAGVATQVPLAVKGFTSQTGALAYFQTVSGSILSHISAAGAFRGPDGSASAPGLGLSNVNGCGIYNAGGAGMALSYGSTALMSWLTGTTFYSYAAASVVTQIRGAASQSANLTEWQNSAGTVLSKVDSVGGFYAPNTVGYGFIGLSGALTYSGGLVSLTNTFSINLASSSAQPARLPTTLISQNQDEIRLILRGMSTQSTDLLQFQTSAAAVLSSVDSAGRHLVPLGALATCGLAFTGDPNTGLYSAAADAVSLVSGGTDRFQVNGTGIGFFAATPVAKAAHIADPSGGATTDAEARTAINAILVALENYGLLATS